MPSATEQELSYEEQLNRIRLQQRATSTPAPRTDDDQSKIALIRNAKRTWAFVRYLPSLTFWGIIWTLLVLHMQLLFFNLLNVDIKLPFVNASSREIGKLNLFELMLVGIIDMILLTVIIINLSIVVAITNSIVSDGVSKTIRTIQIIQLISPVF